MLRALSVLSGARSVQESALSARIRIHLESVSSLSRVWRFAIPRKVGAAILPYPLVGMPSIIPKRGRGVEHSYRTRFGPCGALLCDEGTPTMRFLADSIFLVLFFLLGICWLLAWAAFHIAAGAIHILLVVAAISLIIHIVRGAPSSVAPQSSVIPPVSRHDSGFRLHQFPEGCRASACLSGTVK